MEAAKTETPAVDALEVGTPVETTVGSTVPETPAKRKTKAKAEEAAEPPPHPESDALAFLAGTMGQGIESELADGIAKLQGLLDNDVEHFRRQGSREPQEMVRFIVRAADYIRRRRQLEERRDRFERVMHPKSSPSAVQKDAPAEIKECVLAVFGPEAAAMLRVIQANAEAELRKRIDKTAATLNVWLRHTRTFKVQNSDLVLDVIHMNHEAILGEVGKLLAYHREQSNRLARLNQDQSCAVQACKSACCKAIDEAGGVDVVARALREQMLIHERWWQADEAYAALAQAEATLRTANQQANQLGIDTTKDQEAGTYAAKLKADSTAAAAQVTKLRTEIDDRQRAAVAELVTRVKAGEESARADVSASAARLRAAFPPGFSDAIHHAQFQGTEWAALVDELTANPV